MGANRHPRDRGAQALLQGALAGQGRFDEALSIARNALDSARGSGRGELLNNIAWLQLCAVEAGQVSDGGWADQVDSALREADEEHLVVDRFRRIGLGAFFAGIVQEHEVEIRGVSELVAA